MNSKPKSAYMEGVYTVINDEDIEKMLAEYTGYKGKRYYYYFYGVATAKFGKAMLLGSLVGFANKYYIVGVNEKDIVLIGLGATGKVNGHSIISREKVKSIKISNWLLGMGKKVNFILIDGTILKFNANKVCMGIKKQKENLSKIQELIKRVGYDTKV